MNCPKCAHDVSVVLRTVNNGTATERHRQCSNCGHRWRTIEADRETVARLQALFEAVHKLPTVGPEG